MIHSGGILMAHGDEVEGFEVLYLACEPSLYT